MKIRRRFLTVVLGLAVFPMAADAALTLESIDLAPKEGTTWASSTVRIDFGPGVGMGSVTFTSVNTGFFEMAAAPAAYNAAPYSTYSGDTTLGNGDIYSPDTEAVFRIKRGSAAAGVLSGFTMTVILDSGSFPVGSVLGVRSLGRNATGGYQTLDLGPGLSAADSVRLPTDDYWGPPPDFVETSANHYEPAGVGGNALGRAFRISGSSFSATFLGTYEGGGEAFTIALPVPEPSPFVLLSLVGVAGIFHRKRQ